MKRLILASSSPRRHELLKAMGIPFAVQVSDADETAEGTPDCMVQIIAAKKAHAVADALTDGSFVIGADTLVSLDGKALGKPKNEQDAREMLMSLSGRWHDVFTGVCLIHGDYCDIRCDCSRVLFKNLTEKDLDEYIASGEYIGKAGSYAIQGRGGKLVEKYTGSLENIIGLPVQMLYKMLTASGWFG